MIKDQFIKVKNYKCFENEYCGFESILPINIIIGKNNSGKSSLIELIQYVISPNQEFIDIGRGNTKAEVIISHTLSEIEIKSVFRQDTSGGGIPGINHLEYGKRFIGSTIVYNLLPDGKIKIIEVNKDIIPQAKVHFNELEHRIVPLFKGCILKKITAERDILKEPMSNNALLASNGSGATNLIQEIINRDYHERELIEELLLSEINKITNPEIEFTDIIVRQGSNNLWEIYFKDKINGTIALSKMGSGIKTIIQVLLNILVIPKFEKKDISNYIFAFEELENNLHPSIQRRLFKYIYEFAISKNVCFFITTHSNVVIDLFGSNKDAQLIHIIHNGQFALANKVLSYYQHKNILDDLEVKASDLLQCNGIIWVEGPSDRIYLNKWLSLIDSSLIEGLHYSIVFYGGRLLSNLSFDFYEKELIPLLKINKNSFVLIDRDGKRINAALNKTKVRIQEEIGKENCWITKGREIENYLSKKTLSNWISSYTSSPISFNPNLNEKIGDTIKRSFKKIKIDYEKSKPSYAREIVDFIDLNDIKILDLEQKLKTIVKMINQWNSIKNGT